MEIGFLMLADHSEAVNGKLYMVGGGWNVLRLPELPHEWGFHIALGLDVAWSETNQPHNLQVGIHDPDGVELSEGLDQRLVMSIGTTATFSTPGPHAAIVQVNGEELGRARFYLIEDVEQ